VFDLSLTKLLVLAVIALVVFGPKELPKIAAQAGRALRDLRRIAEGAKADLREGLGPEFQDFDFEDLNPRRFVQKHLLDEPATPGPGGTARPGGNGMGGNGVGANGMAGAAAGGTTAANGSPAVLQAGDDPPFDFEAT
jgi:sec-independent protein translocase protein TatB